jgi:hypothetical protein
MFTKCKLLLFQGGNSVEIVLNRPTGFASREGMTVWGTYTSNGGSIPPDQRRWLFAMAKWECRLMDAGGPGIGMGGGGLGYAELAPVPPAAILSMAGMTDRAIEPMSRGNTAQGRIDNGFAIGSPLNKGPITWNLEAFQAEGTSFFQTP